MWTSVMKELKNHWQGLDFIINTTYETFIDIKISHTWKRM